MDDKKLTDTANKNIKYLDDIQDHNRVHENSFKQVFFKPDPAQIKSSTVGAFIKDIYGVDQVTPDKRIAGYHTRDSCELNTAIYANSVIDYNSPTNYSPGIDDVKVNGDFANSPNFFLTPNLAAAVEGQTFSVEMRGYIAAQKPGNYSVSSNAIAFFKKNVLIWVGNNALKTHRRENAQFIVENGRQIKNESFAMVVGEYTPFRIQYSGDAILDYKTQTIWVNGDGYPISVFARNKNENNLYYYSLSPSNKTNFYNCDVYKGSELQKYKSDAKQQVQIVWSKPLDERTEYIFLGMNGILRAHNSNYEKIGSPIFPGNERQKSNRNYKLELYKEPVKPLCIKNPDNTTIPLFTIEKINTVRNEEWSKTPNPMVKTMTNREEQVGDKRISKNRISESNPLFSEDFRYKLCIMRDNNQKKILALLASTSPTTQFYTAEPDLKMNKLFYASTYIDNKFLREVPANLQTSSNTYTSYADMYPLSTGYTETVSTDCEKQCNLDPGCNHFYKVTGSTGTKCLISNNPVSTFLPKQPDSTYTSSELYVKDKKIRTGDATKDAVYDKTQYLSDGYSDGVNLRFADFPVERKVLSETDTPGPDGTDYIVLLRNNVNESTNGSRPISTTNINNPMIAGKIENFDTVVNGSLTKLDQIDGQIAQYGKDQYKVGQNSGKIKKNIASINTTFLDMSGNPQKYDFTGQTIYALEEDRTLSSALLKDNAIYKTEQNTLYMITTLAMATFLVTAILISK